MSLRCADRLFPTWFYHGNGLFFTSDSRFFITKKNTNHLCCFFSPRSQAYLLQLWLLPTTVFSASSTVVRFLHCIPQVQALKVLTYDKRLFVSSIRIYRQSRPRTMTTPNIYHHMGKLVQAKFVNTRIDRNRNYYSINKNYINQLLDELKGILRCCRQAAVFKPLWAVCRTIERKPKWIKLCGNSDKEWAGSDNLLTPGERAVCSLSVFCYCFQFPVSFRIFSTSTVSTSSGNA